MTDNLQIQTALLKAVQKITKASFDERLGDEFMLAFSSYSGNVLTMYLSKDGVHCECFSNFLAEEKQTSWQVLLPISAVEIIHFEASVNLAINEVFDYIEEDRSRQYEVDARLDHVTEAQFNG